MNENICSTGNDWEVEHTDHSNSEYAHDQGKRLVKLSEVKEGEKFRVPNSSRDVVWTRTVEDEQYMGGVEQGDVRWHVRVVSDTIVQLIEEPVLDTELSPDQVQAAMGIQQQYADGYRLGIEALSDIVALLTANTDTEIYNAAIQLIQNTKKKLPVPDAIVDTVVSDLSVQGDLLQEQIQKIRERDVPEVAKMTIQEAIGRYGMNKLTDEQREEVMSFQGGTEEDYEKWAEQELAKIPVTDISELEKQLMGNTGELQPEWGKYIAGTDPINHLGYEPSSTTLYIGFRDKNGNISKHEVPRNVYNYDEQQNTPYQQHSTDDIQDPVSADESIRYTEPVYNSLEQILADIQYIGALPLSEEEKQRAIRKLQRTIDAQMYLQKGEL